MTLIQRIQAVLTPDLLSPFWRRMVEGVGLHPTTGHCYAAAEAAWHLLGARASGWRAMVHRNADDETHWWLEHVDTGAICDPTAEQFLADGVCPPYGKGRACGFLTAQPSRRAAEIIRRVTASDVIHETSVVNLDTQRERG